MNNLTLLKAIIAILVLLNAGILAFFLSNRPPRPESPFEYLSRELHFSEAQREQYAKLRDEHRHKMEENRTSMDSLHEQYFNMLGSAEADSLKLNATVDSIALYFRKGEMYTFAHFKNVRALCTGEQTKRFDAVIFEAWKKLKPRPGKPGTK